MCNNLWAGWPRRLILVAGIVLLASGFVQASPWTNPSGTNLAFGWSGGKDTTDKYGSPTVTGLGFNFLNMSNFRAAVGVQATDIAEVTVDVRTPNPDGPAIHIITVDEWGTWSKDVSTPTDFATCRADFSVGRQAPTPMGSTGSLALRDSMGLDKFEFRGDGTWYASRQLTAGASGNPLYADVDWERFKIVVTNTLQVAGSADPASFIEKTGMRIILPEPASALLVLLGLVPLALRGRRQ